MRARALNAPPFGPPVLCFAFSLLWATSGHADDSLFVEQIAPILSQRCLSCHNDQDREGDFSLETREGAFDGGHIVPGKSDSSRLFEVITPIDGQAEMPQDADPIPPEQRELIQKWIDSGAAWPDSMNLEAASVADLDWWSLRPLEQPLVPAVESVAGGFPILNPIDAFVQNKLSAQGLEANPLADRATLIRRLYFDLIGLPPSPQEIEDFVKDSSPHAYEKLVDRLLESDHYGERWARHWLDVVHYADTHGYDKDKLRPNAWPYRDYVIRSLNEDKPYARFIREQLAGDVLWPHTRDGITATGFIAAGPWDFIGHAEVPETKTDGKIARHLDRDDMVSSTMNTFCSMTVQCARCHNHKFDPVTQHHYYRLQAVFSALDRADRPYDILESTSQERLQLTQDAKRLESESKVIQSLVAEAGGKELADLDQAIRTLEEAARADGQSRPEFGFHSQIVNQPDIDKWVQVDFESPTTISKLRFVGCHDNFNGIGHGFGFPVRYRIEASNDPTLSTDVFLVLDRTNEDHANPGTTPQTFELAKPIEARYLRFTATHLATRANDYIFALAELEAYDSEGVNRALGKTVTSLDSIEAGPRWGRSNLVDGFYYGITVSAETRQQLEQKRQERQQLLVKRLPEDLVERQKTNERGLKNIKEQIAALPQPAMVYAGTIHTGSGAFVGTGAKGGKPRDIFVLHRGNIQSPRERVEPGTVPIRTGEKSEFDLAEGHAEGDRRVALANWIASHDNPLTWRSIVNRVWQYHFGRGIVDTPNDFGRMGQLPSHPELLDWLAVEFRDGGQSMKKLHKLLVMSATYQLASTHSEANAARDAGNVYLWRANRRRLTAEEIRDSVLQVSGKLNREMYGPGYHLFVIEHPEHSPHYEYHLHDPEDPASHRRSIYRFVVRSQPDPFMATLDCADSSQSVPKRDETITALQALSLLNNKFMLSMSEQFAERIRLTSNDPVAQAKLAFLEATGRSPNDTQLDSIAAYASEHGLESLCRVLFNLNEFVFID